MYSSIPAEEDRNQQYQHVKARREHAYSLFSLKLTGIYRDIYCTQLHLYVLFESIQNSNTVLRGSGEL